MYTAGAITKGSKPGTGTKGPTKPLSIVQPSVKGISKADVKKKEEAMKDDVAIALMAQGAKASDAAAAVGSKVGRFINPEGRVLSARLNPTEALLDDDPTNDVMATVDDVVEAAGPTTGGGRHKLRGAGAKEALAKLTSDAIAQYDAASKAIDDLSGQFLEKVPTLLKTVAAGAGLRFVLNNPSLFANIVAYAKDAGIALITPGDGATWTDYAEAIGNISGSIKDLAVAAATAPAGGPAGAILFGLFAMRARAKLTNTTITELIKSDAAVLKSAVQSVAGSTASAAYAQYSAYLKAYDAEAKEVTIGQLKDLAKNVKMPLGEGAMEMRQAARAVGAPSAEPPGPGFEEKGPSLVPAQPLDTGKIKAALDKIASSTAKIPQKEKEAAKKITGEVSGNVVRLIAKGGYRKTKKVKSKRRQTHRRRAPKYLAAPVFAY